MNRIKNYIIGTAIILVIILPFFWIMVFESPVHLHSISTIQKSKNSLTLRIEEHFYTVIENREDVLQLEEMVTYVLLPRKAGTPKVEERYRDLLNSIMGKSDRMKLEHNLTISELERINRFILTMKNSDDEINLANYNYKLSKEILDYFRKKLDYKMFKGEGPYLLTTRSKVFTEDKIESVLYLNLARFDESAIVETVKIYMNSLESDGTIEFSWLDGLKFVILDHVVDANNGIEKIVQVFRPTPIHAKRN